MFRKAEGSGKEGAHMHSNGHCLEKVLPFGEWICRATWRTTLFYNLMRNPSCVGHQHLCSTAEYHTHRGAKVFTVGSFCDSTQVNNEVCVSEGTHLWNVYRHILVSDQLKVEIFVYFGILRHSLSNCCFDYSILDHLIPLMVRQNVYGPNSKNT